MKILKNELGMDLGIRTQENYPIEGVEFIDITPLTLNGQIYDAIIEKFSSLLASHTIDYIVSPEARGFLFGCPVASRLQTGFIPVRKKGKIPPNAVEAEFEFVKEYGKDILCLPKLDHNQSYTGKKVYILDDIYATGNTIRSLRKTLSDLGATVIGVGCVMNIVELNDDAKEITSLIDINEG